MGRVATCLSLTLFFYALTPPCNEQQSIIPGTGFEDIVASRPALNLLTNHMVREYNLEVLRRFLAGASRLSHWLLSSQNLLFVLYVREFRRVAKKLVRALAPNSSEASRASKRKHTLQALARNIFDSFFKPEVIVTLFFSIFVCAMQLNLDLFFCFQADHELNLPLLRSISPPLSQPQFLLLSHTLYLICLCFL